MDMYIWDHYHPEEITEKIKYWVDLWEDLIDNFNKRFFGLDLLNPQLLVRDIIDEIEFNDLQNKENNGYLYRQLSSFLKSDPALKKGLGAGFCLLRREFNKGKNLYLLQLCKSVLEGFRDGSYFEHCYGALKDILLDPLWKEHNEKHILNMTQFLIVELLLKGYSLKSIKSFPRNLFSTYETRNGYIITDYPTDTKWTDFVKDDALDESAFNEALESEMKTLTVDKRLQQLSAYYRGAPSRRYFVFQIEGLKGDVDFNIGDVNFYSPRRKRYVKSGPSIERNLEFFRADKHRYWVNAAVPVDDLDTDASKSFAVASIERALDLLRCFFCPTTRFKVIDHDYIIVDTDGKHAGSSYAVSPRDTWYKWQNALDLNAHDVHEVLGVEVVREVGKYLFRQLDRQADIEQKIAYSLHWYRKGEETVNDEDKLLHYWIVIENILSFRPAVVKGILRHNRSHLKYSLAREFLPPIQVRNSIFSLATELYDYLHSLLHSRQGDRALLTLPDELLELCNLSPKTGARFSLVPFVKNLVKLADRIERRIIKEKALYVHRFYTDNHFAHKAIQKQFQQVKDDVLLIYRYRNKIVHRAHFEAYVLPYLAQKAGKLAGDLLRRVVYDYSSGKGKTAEEILLRAYVAVKTLTERLERNESVDLLELEL